MERERYKVITQQKTSADEGEAIIDMVNKLTSAGHWRLFFIDLAFGRAVLELVNFKESDVTLS